MDLKSLFKEIESVNASIDNQKVILAHFLLLDRLKEQLTVKKNTLILECDYYLNNVQIYFTSKVPRSSFSVMTRLEYKKLKEITS